MIDLNQQVVIIHLLALKGIVCSSRDRVSVRRPASGDKICDAAMLVALVVVDVPAEHHHAEMCVRLSFLQDSC